MDSLLLEPSAPLRGEVELPGSKSLANRALLLAALADADRDAPPVTKPPTTEATTQLLHLPRGDDVDRMRWALALLTGTSTDDLPPQDPAGGGSIPGDAAGSAGVLSLDLGNAGTAMRPLTAVLAAAGLGSGTRWTRVVLRGQPRMYERPLGPLIAALRLWGARITCLQREGFPPLCIEPPRGGQPVASIDGSLSSQFVSAALLAAPLWARHHGRAVTLCVRGERISQPYIAMTERLLARFGITLDRAELDGPELERPGRDGPELEGALGAAVSGVSAALSRGRTLDDRG